MPEIRRCWCGNSQFSDFSSDYHLCAACGTLVLKYWPDEPLTRVEDKGELYSRDYYLKHMMASYGYPDLLSRTRNDLRERNTYWLRTLLKYRLPPGRILELGCAHGGFVALMRQCGFDASGLELSPWLVEYARTTFDIPMFQGPLEEQNIPEGSLDVIVLMDVLEHLPDPVGTMAQALRLLRADGFLLIQTPRYPEGISYPEMVDRGERFLEHLKPKEHLFLFSQRAVRELFHRLGAEHLVFELPIFDHNMFFLVSRQPLEVIPREQRDAMLQSTPQRRLILALLDLYEYAEMLQKEAAARLEAIEYLKREADERLQVINRLSQALQTREPYSLGDFLRRLMRGRSR